MTNLRVLIVNDSPTMCAALRLALGVAHDIEVIGEVNDGSKALEAVSALRPDVVLMDVVMPGCDGYQATRAIMSQVPTPVVMVTAAENPDDEHVIFQALGAGALSVTRAPPAPGTPSHRLASATLAQLVRAMAAANVRRDREEHRIAQRRVDVHAGQRVNAVGMVASAGGPPALLTIFQHLSGRALPPILLVQHMSPGFAPGFARWLGERTGHSVVLATHGEKLLPNAIYLAPDEHHLGVGSNGRLIVSNDPPVGLFRPSGDFLLSSLARTFGDAAAAVVLSGMGSDGAAGASEIAAAGGVVVAQDASSSAIDGMPRAVRERVAGARAFPLDGIAAFLSTLANAK